VRPEGAENLRENVDHHLHGLVTRRQLLAFRLSALSFSPQLYRIASAGRRVHRQILGLRQEWRGRGCLYYGRLGSDGILEAGRADGSPRKPTAASEYKRAAITRSAFIPMINERFSSRPPTTAPSIFAPRAAAGDSAERNSEANNKPAKKTGMAKTRAAKAPTMAAEPGMRLKGTK